MDTYMTLTAFGPHAEEALNKAGEEIKRVEATLSTGMEDSEVVRINTEGGGRISTLTATMLEESLKINADTGGAFNPAIYPVMKLWGFTDDHFRVPSKEEIDQALTLVDVSAIHFDESSKEVRFDKEGMAVDFGGIAKGYTSSRIMQIFEECGVESGMVNLGGNVQTFGMKPDGSLWRVAVQDPKKEGNYLCVLDTHDRAIITSGGYERFFEEGGVTYHHIIDPADGYPADNGLVSVTIVCEDGALADGLSTSLFVMGRERAEAYWREHSDVFDVILFADDGKLYVSKGLEGSFTSDYETVLID